MAKKMLEHKDYHNNHLTDAALNVEPGDNAKYIQFSKDLAFLPDIDLNDSSKVGERLQLFFDICSKYDLKPTVAGMGLALNGMDRRRLWEIRTGSASNARQVKDLPRESVDLIKKAYRIMENLWENYMQNGKINPVSGIFLGKNNFGYQDKTEYVVNTGNDERQTYDPEELRRRYLPESERLALEQAHVAGLPEDQ